MASSNNFIASCHCALKSLWKRISAWFVTSDVVSVSCTRENAPVINCPAFAIVHGASSQH